jgi:hypothetical protein
MNQTKRLQPTNTARWHWNRVVGDRTYGFTAISKSKQTGNGGAKLSSALWNATPIWRPPNAAANICGFLPIRKPSTWNVRPWVG